MVCENHTVVVEVDFYAVLNTGADIGYHWLKKTRTTIWDHPVRGEEPKTGSAKV